MYLENYPSECLGPDESLSSPMYGGHFKLVNFSIISLPIIIITS